MIRKVNARGKVRYRVIYRMPEDRNTKSKTFDTAGEAKAFEGDLAKAKTGVVEFPTAKISNLTLEQFGYDYKTKYMDIELSPGTQDIYAHVWNAHIMKRPIARMPLSTITRETVQQLKADLMADGVGDATVGKTLSVLSAVLSKAVEWGKLPYNPAEGIKKPSNKRQRKPEPMPAESVQELISGLEKPRDRLLVAIMGYAGLRPGEALALTKADLQGEVINVDKAIALGQEKDTKTGVDRVVPILPELRPFLDDLPDGLLFPRADGLPWLDHDWRNWRKRTFKPAVKRLGDEWANFRPYDLRHSFASRLLMEAWTPLEVAEVMGHSVEILLSTYAHVISRMKWAKLRQAA